ncbi:MAG: hypothetical protein PUF51_04415 [Bifidobacteriaceae bacterium]|nr:hypothetical protein [Bifidobacteriaceae bacterium]
MNDFYKPSSNAKWGGDGQNSFADDEALAAAIHLDERIAQLNEGAGGLYGKMLHESLKFAKGVVLDSNALYCETDDGSGHEDFESPTWVWFRYFFVAFTDTRGRRLTVWTDDVYYTAKNLPIGSAVVVQYADREHPGDIRIRQLLTYLDFNVSMPGTVKAVQGGHRLHVTLGDDDYQAPGSFGSLWRRAPWGARYATSGMDGCRLYSAPTQPYDTEDSETARESRRGARAFSLLVRAMYLGFIVSFFATFFLPALRSLVPSMNLPDVVAWPFLVLFLILSIVCGSVYSMRYGHAKNVASKIGKRRRHTDEPAHVLDVVTVPIFNMEQFCGYGYVAKLRTANGATVWAMGDPETPESYLVQGGVPPVVAGDDAVLVRTSDNAMYAHSTAA